MPSVAALHAAELDKRLLPGIDATDLTFHNGSNRTPDGSLLGARPPDFSLTPPISER
jgi:hypothetical protein